MGVIDKMICSNPECGKEIELYGCSCEDFQQAIKDNAVKVSFAFGFRMTYSSTSMVGCPFCEVKLQRAVIYKASSPNNPDCRSCGGQMEIKEKLYKSHQV